MKIFNKDSFSITGTYNENGLKNELLLDDQSEIKRVINYHLNSEYLTRKLSEYRNKQRKKQTYDISSINGDRYLWIESFDNEIEEVNFVCRDINYNYEYNRARYSDLNNSIMEIFSNNVIVLNSDMKCIQFDGINNNHGYLIEQILSERDDFKSRLTSLDNKEVIRNYEVIIQDDSVHYYLISASCCRCNTSDENYYIIFINDVSSVFLEYSTLMKNNIELFNNNEILRKNYTSKMLDYKITSIEQLSAGLAHEINNPFSYIVNNLNCLFKYFDVIKDFINKNIDANIKDNSDIDLIFEDIPEMKKESNIGIDKVKKIIESLMSFSGNNLLNNHDVVDVGQMIKDILTITKSDYNEQIKILIDIKDLSNTFCIPNEINQAFMNIIINSIEASKKSNEPPEIVIKAEDVDQYIKVVISNNGPPIKDEDLLRIFEPFYTTKKVGEGLGLGLSIAYDIIVNKHQGQLKMSNINGSVQSEIYLPIIKYSGGDNET